VRKNMKTKIKDYVAGDEVEGLILRFTDVQIRKTTSNADYASMLGFDGDDIIETKIWKFSDEIKEILKNGEIYSVVGLMKDYQGKMQLNVKELRIADDQDDFNKDDFLEFAKMSKEDLKDAVREYIVKMENPILKKLVLELLKDYVDEYFVHPAAKVMHHNYVSGLAYHVYSMLKLADAHLELYPFLNKDLVYAGIILHDLGKIVEMTKETGEYTKAGNLLGHITISVNKLHQKSVELGVEESEETLLLQHIILSHHGLLEYGSPKEPIIPEAYLIYMLDYTDSRMASLEKEICKDGKIPEEAKGTYTQPIMAFDRKNFYIPNIK
jgi:3'-5' exoribonuclease